MFGRLARPALVYGLLGATLVGSCSTEGPPRGGLMLMIGRDGPLPIDRLELRVVSKERTLLQNTYRVPDEALLPTSLAIVSNGDPGAAVDIAVTGWQGDVPLDRRDAIVTQVPADRVAALTILLSGRCSSKVMLEGGEARSSCGTGSTCDPSTGDCVGAEIDASTLPTYTSGAEDGIEVGGGDGGTGNGQGGASGAEGGAIDAGGSGGSATGAEGAQSGSGGASSGGAGGSAGVSSGGSAGVSSGGANDAGQSGSGGASGDGGSGGSPLNPIGPCDIYESANTPCVAAYSTVRRLSSTYAGPLYQVRKGGPDPNTGSGGQTQDIASLANGFADAAAHAAFCGTETCTFSRLYDQSGEGNDLTVAKRGCYGCSSPEATCASCSGTACQNDYETDASKSITVGGQTVYTLHMEPREGYRHSGTGWPTVAPAASGMPIGNAANGQGVYMVAEGKAKRPDLNTLCCWSFGNLSNDNCYAATGSSNALMFGTAFWGKGAGSGPWFLGDFDGGVWAGGVNGDLGSSAFDTNGESPSMTMSYAFGILKTQPNNYAIRVADATTGTLKTAYDGAAPDIFAGAGEWQMAGGIGLGITTDNSNSANGTFLEGAITSSRPTDATDAAVHENVKALGYGQ